MGKTEITNIPYKEMLQLILALNGFFLIKNTFLNGVELAKISF